MTLTAQIHSYQDDERWTHQLFEDAEFKASDRNRFAASLLAQVHEHCVSTRLLLTMGEPGSRFGTACALMRPILEGLVRALWILDCATDEQIQNRIDHNEWRSLSLRNMTAAVDDTLQTGGFYQGLHDRFYDAMCSYTHGGMRVVNNNLTGEAIQPTSSEREWAAVVSFAHTMDLLTTHASLTICEKLTEAAQCLKRAEEVLTAKLDT